MSYTDWTAWCILYLWCCLNLFCLSSLLLLDLRVSTVISQLWNENLSVCHTIKKHTNTFWFQNLLTWCVGIMAGSGKYSNFHCLLQIRSCSAVLFFCCVKFANVCWWCQNWFFLISHEAVKFLTTWSFVDLSVSNGHSGSAEVWNCLHVVLFWSYKCLMSFT